MQSQLLPQGVKGKAIHLVGVKGVGMTALAEILSRQGARLTGSDTAEVFFTDEILRALGIAVTERFDDHAVTPQTDLVIYSAAYSPHTHPELRKAFSLGVPCLVYPAALGRLSAAYDAAGICGVHGKTTTTALAGILIQALSLPATVLVGSQVPGFGNRSTHIGGDRYLVAETCEYKRHFLHFNPQRIVITSIEEDHQDYFKDIEDLYDAFTEYALRLPTGGTIIHCEDDSGAGEVVSRVRTKRPDIRLVPYGFAASGPFRIHAHHFEPGASRFRLEGFEAEFILHVPGRHSIADAAAALALTAEIVNAEGRTLTRPDLDRLNQALASFTGTRRRSEIVGEAAGILFMDDYAHHPTAIRTTLSGLKEYYPQRRLVADFMSHTFSRTAALLDRFAASFESADEVILHKIYASARERSDGTVSGETLYDRTQRCHTKVRFFRETADAVPYLTEHLSSGDLFVTMGAGDNWKLGQELFRYFSRQGVDT